MLDFVPTHTALDYPWVQSYSEFYIRGTSQDFARELQNCIALEADAID